MRDEYDISKLKGAVRGKYHDRYASGTNLVLLQPDVAKAFPDSDAVNEALRSLLKVDPQSPKKNQSSQDG